MKKSLHMRVSGTVHGVGFRKYVLLQAEQRGLTGWVRNRSDDTVEIFACGVVGILEDFYHVVKLGSKNSVVVEVGVDWGECEAVLTGDFEIRKSL